MNELFQLHEGNSPLLINVPHAGTYVPPNISARMTPDANALPDTDWRVPELYPFADEVGATLLVATHSRYVVDLNRSIDGKPLYAGQYETAVCPLETFTGEPLYAEGAEPSTKEIDVRIEKYWQPYHCEIHALLNRLRQRFGFALLWDAHSIRTRVPRLFDGALPDLNFGTASGRSCAPELAARLLEVAAASPYSAVLDGRFKGGFITRHYGRPRHNIHAVQMELTRQIYMSDDPPYTLHPADAQRLSQTLRELIDAMLTFRSFA